MCVVETIHSIGFVLFAFKVLPSVNIIRGAILMMGVCVVPGVLKVFSRLQDESWRGAKIALDVAAALLQLSLVFIWPITISFEGGREKLADMWPITVSLPLISVAWWENYVDTDTSLGAVGRFLLRMKRRVARTRSKTYIVAHLWKIPLTFALMIGCLVGLHGYSVRQLFDFSVSDVTCRNALPGARDVRLEDYAQLNRDWLMASLIQITASLLCYLAARAACKVRIQYIGFSIPLVLAPLATFGLLVGGCEVWNDNPLYFAHRLPTYLFWRCHDKDELGQIAIKDSIWVIALWWLSEVFITRHIWFPKVERLAKTSKYVLHTPLAGACLWSTPSTVC